MSRTCNYRSRSYTSFHSRNRNRRQQPERCHTTVTQRPSRTACAQVAEATEQLDFVSLAGDDQSVMMGITRPAKRGNLSAIVADVCQRQHEPAFAA